MDNEVEQEGVTASIVVWCVGLSLALLTPLLLFVIQFYWQLKRPIPKKSKKTKDSESEETKGKEETLIFRNLSFSVPTAQGDKTIVNNVSGIVRPGELCALMGQSGAGKTTLLHAISGSLSSKGKIEGEVYINGERISGSLLLQGRCGIMMQEDLLINELTVEELLNMAASLQLKHLSQSERKNRVNEAIEFLGLKELRNRTIGSPESGNLSGGQRRRVSLAIEGLLSQHQILFLDEPTTGLSANDAGQLIDLLSRLSKERKTTIIFSLHSPRSYVFENHIDRLLLMHNGQTAFFGKPTSVSKYFGESSNPFNEGDYLNPADQMMDVMADHHQANSVLSHWKSSNNDKELDHHIEDFLNNQQPSDRENDDDKYNNKLIKLIMTLFLVIRNTIIESKILFHFGNRLFIRKKNALIISLFIEFGYSIFKGLCYSQLEDETPFIYDRFASVFRSLDPGTGMAWLTLYVQMIPISNRDLLVGRYGPFAFCGMWLYMTILRSLLMSFVNLIVFYWIAGLQPIFTHFLLFLVISFFYKLMMYGCSLFIAAIFESDQLAANLIGIIQVLLFVNCGFYVVKELIFVVLRWTSAFSMFYYAYEALSWIDISGRTFTCDDYSGCEISGADFLQSIGYTNRLSLDFAVLFLWAIGPLFFFCIYVVLVRVSMQQYRSYLLYHTNEVKRGDAPLQLENSDLNPNVHYEPVKFTDQMALDRINELEKEEEDELLLNNRKLNNDDNELERHEGDDKNSDQKNISLSSPYSTQKKITFDEEDKDTNFNVGDIYNTYIPDPMKKILSKTQQVRQRSFIQQTELMYANDHLLIELLPSVPFTIKNLQFEVVKDEKTFYRQFLTHIPFLIKPNLAILKNVSVTFLPKTMVAIMGPSGSGKSTFLHAICGHLNTNNQRRLYGEIKLGGIDISLGRPLHVLAFMSQHAEDYIMPGLSVLETFEFVANLYLPNKVIRWADKKTFIDNLLLALRLYEIRDQPIGKIGQRGVSGGQLRRIAMGIEVLMRRTKVLLLDEPTSGLSSSGATEIVTILQNFAKKLGFTIILTIHQPRNEILDLFDKVVILSKGHLVYNGRPGEINGYMQSIGKPLPINENKADSLMDEIVADEISVGKDESINSHSDRLMVKYYQDHPNNDDDLIIEPDDNRDRNQIEKDLKKPWLSSRWRQTLSLVERKGRLLKRNPYGSLETLFFAINPGIIFGLFYLQIENIADNLHSLIAACALIGSFWILITTLPTFYHYSHKEIYNHEINQFLYKSYVSYMVNQLFFFVEYALGAAICSTISFWMIGFSPIFWSYVVYLLAYILISWITITITLCICYAVKQLDSATNITFVCFISFSFEVCGFLVLIPHLPNYIRWMTWISPTRYFLELCYYAILGGRSFPCTDNIPPFGFSACPVYGNDILESIGYSLNPVLRNCLILLGAILVFNLIGYYFYQRKVNHWKLFPPKSVYSLQ